MSGDKSTAYKPHEVEQKWLDKWLKSDLFKAERQSGKDPFSMVIPPPNITGSLHMGHALNNTLQDILLRLKRMQGYSTCWFPGTDHAGIATQVVVEKELRKEGKTRFDLGREKFIARVWEWKKQYGGIIDDQLKKLGVGCDWSRYSFTMDGARAKAVKEAFVRLHDKGVIYRGNRIVNWCPKCQTALSDLEVEHREDEAPGVLYHLAYKVLGSKNESIVIATTRPETILADVAVAVHPDDPRYKKMIGKYAVLPLVGRKLPIIADEWADPAVGTGAVKITPAHDPNDFEVGERHNLPSIRVIDLHGKMMMEEISLEKNVAPENKKWLKDHYDGLDRFECREKIVEELKRFKVYVKEEAWAANPGRCARSGDIIEPALSMQWFMEMKTLAAPAIKAVESGKVKFFPDRFSKLYLEWMGNIRDWCISRQLWWGHQIPAWYCLKCNEKKIARSGVKVKSHPIGAPVETTPSQWHYTILEGAVPIVSREKPVTCAVCGSHDLIQDPDVLDTWFSSGLWPLSVMGWPLETDDLKTFYPTGVLSTGRDIINLWVARMIMFGLEFRGQVPFSHVSIHPTILDKDGRRMSKSKGTGVDPLDLIAKYGADATRLGIVMMAQGQDVKFNPEKIEQARNFSNKVWNAARFVLANSPRPDDSSRLGPGGPRFYDVWILLRLHETAEEVTRSLENYDFAEAAFRLYQFFWDDYCDWYLELSKMNTQASRAVLESVLVSFLKLAHPFIPFVTEEIWHLIPGESGFLVDQKWPKISRVDSPDGQIEEWMRTLTQTVKGIRNLRAEAGLKPKEKCSITIRTEHPDLFKKIGGEISFLALVENLNIVDLSGEPPKKALSFLAGGDSVYLPLDQIADIPAEIRRLSQEREKCAKDLEGVRRLLQDGEFRGKAKKEVIEKTEEKEKNLVQKIFKIEERVSQLR